MNPPGVNRIDRDDDQVWKGGQLARLARESHGLILGEDH